MAKALLCLWSKEVQLHQVYGKEREMKFSLEFLKQFIKDIVKQFLNVPAQQFSFSLARGLEQLYPRNSMANIKKDMLEKLNS